MNYTDNQLKQVLAKMLPALIESTQVNGEIFLLWKAQDRDVSREFVQDTELLHLCWMVEEGINDHKKQNQLISEIADACWSCSNPSNQVVFNQIHATWQQRVIALCKVKGVEIV